MVCFAAWRVTGSNGEKMPNGSCAGNVARNGTCTPASMISESLDIKKALDIKRGINKLVTQPTMIKVVGG